MPPRREKQKDEDVEKGGQAADTDDKDSECLMFSLVVRGNSTNATGVDRPINVGAYNNHSNSSEILVLNLSVGQSHAAQVPADRIWTLYSAKAERYDEMLVARLKGSMDSVVVFVSDDVCFSCVP